MIMEQAHIFRGFSSWLPLTRVGERRFRKSAYAETHMFPVGRCRTISLETGAQNIQMCITMLQLSFTAEQLVQVLSFPLAYGLFQLLDGFLIVAGR